MSQTHAVHETNAGAGVSDWNLLHKISGVAALVSAALIPLSIVAFFIWPIYPGTVADMFALIQKDKLAGLMSLDFMYLAANALAVPIFLSLYFTLRRTNESLAVIALALGFIGVVALIPARPIAEMFALSEKFAAATDAQRSQIVAAGVAILAQFRGTAFNAHYIFGSVSLLISSFLMLRSNIYSKAVAYVGIISNTLVFGLFVPVIGVYLSLLSVFPFLTLWFVQIGRSLFRFTSGVAGNK